MAHESSQTSAPLPTIRGKKCQKISDHSYEKGDPTVVVFKKWFYEA